MSDDVYAFAASYIAEHGYSPSYREIKEGCNMASLQTVRARLVELREAGLIGFADNTARTITITGRGCDGAAQEDRG